MKKLIGYFATLCFLQATIAQKDAAGIWEGKLNLGATSLRLVFHVQKEGAGYSATMDSPDQSAMGIKASRAIVSGDSLLIDLLAIGGHMAGLLQNDSTCNGVWIQGRSLPLLLKKVTAVTAPNRPQTPKPPYPYASEEVIYYNKDKAIQYGATITIPNGKGPFPAIVFITGSGQENRDEELFGHKPFLVLADYLTRQGYAVLRVDDRGIGQTTGDVINATSKDFAGDVMTGLDYLKSRKEVDKTKLGLLGHSEGGMIAQLVSAERRDVTFVISMAGPGQRIDSLMAGQNAAIFKSVGFSPSVINDYLKLYNVMVPAIVNAPSATEAKEAVVQLLTNWIKQTPKATVAATTKISTDADKEKYADGLIKQMYNPWYRYFFQYNPPVYIKKITAKVLALNGDKDIQVLAAPNLAGWKAALQESSSKKFEVVELKGLNHLFQHCTTCTAQEYGVIEETIAPEALQTIGAWLKQNVQ